MQGRRRKGEGGRRPAESRDCPCAVSSGSLTVPLSWGPNQWLWFGLQLGLLCEHYLPHHGKRCPPYWNKWLLAVTAVRCTRERKAAHLNVTRAHGNRSVKALAVIYRLMIIQRDLFWSSTFIHLSPSAGHLFFDHTNLEVSGSCWCPGSHIRRLNKSSLPVWQYHTLQILLIALVWTWRF